MENLVNTFFPAKCFNCGENYGDICRACLNECLIARNFYCIVCDKPVVKGKTHVKCEGNFTPRSIFSAFEYSGIVRKCIKTAKYRSKTFAPLKKLALEAAKMASTCNLQYQGYTVTSIPLSRKRNKERGFNQAGLILSAIARQYDLSHRESILARKKQTKAQYGQARKERFENLRGAFVCNRNIKGQKILLVDDICTTGATLLEASKVLRSAEAQEVQCFTLAKKF